MSLTKKDPSLRVAANDPHLVSLGGGRLSTAVTIHYIPVGDTTIGSATTCCISLNGTGVRPTHCTIYRSEENEVTIVPEQDARILIDGSKITQETNLTQGAMITIGNSNYLRFNNPAEAQMMRSAMGSNERISMPQIDFTQPVQQQQQQQQRNSAKSNGSSVNDDDEVVGNQTANSMMEQQQALDIEKFYESKIHPAATLFPNNKSGYDNVPVPIDINGLHCPKVFTADLVTVNMPAKDVLGQKYASFAKNLAENHRSDKIVNNALRNNQMNVTRPSHQQQVGGGGGQQHNGGSAGNAASGNYVNIPNASNFIQNTNASANINGVGGSSGDYLTKVMNTTPTRNGHHQNLLHHHNHHHYHQNVTPYDRYPKPGTYGGLQIFPMNGVNTEINNGSMNCASPNKRNLSNLSSLESERLEDMLKICTEYADRQQQLQQQQQQQQQQHNQSNNSSITSSPIVQNRIKTNGSLPRDKKSPFYHDLSGTQLQQSFSSSNCSSSSISMKAQANGSITCSSSSSSSGYENVRLIGQNRVEINGQCPPTAAASPPQVVSSPKPGYENIVIGKYVPQSPRTKIRTTCMSPKKDNSFSNNIFGTPNPNSNPNQLPPPIKYPKPNKQNEYEQLIKSFEEKLKLEIEAIEECSRNQVTSSTSTTSAAAESTPLKRTNININNLKLNLEQPSSLQNSPKLSKKPAPAPRNISKCASGSTSSLPSVPKGETDIDKLKSTRKELLKCIQRLKTDISELRKQEDEVLRELDLEKALVSAEVHSVGDSLGELEHVLKSLQTKIYRLEAQRNATRVMEENQQAKLKQSIEMKQDQIRKLKDLLKQKPNNDCLKEELQNVIDTLENDRKTFEDLEFQYLEEESEWHAYREELAAEEKSIKLKLQDKLSELQRLEKQELSNQSYANSDAKTLKNNIITLVSELGICQERIKSVENSICDISGQLRCSSSDDDERCRDDASASSSPPIQQQQQSNLVNGVMSQSLFGSAELLCPKRNNDDFMSKSVNENMFYNNKIELPSAQGATATSTPKRKQLHVIDIDDTESSIDSIQHQSPKSNADKSDDPLLRLKYNFDGQSTGIDGGGAGSDRVKFNLSLGSDDFEVNPLEKRVPSQDDIDRICKVTSDAPISTKGATTKIFDSIKEIERNRQLLLAQQGHHVIEHERQRMNNLKKKSHDEARAQYLLMLNSNGDTGGSSNNASSKKEFQMQELQKLGEENVDPSMVNKENQQQFSNDASKATAAATTAAAIKTDQDRNSQQRHSQPEFQSPNYLQMHQKQQQQQRLSPRPLSEANSDISCDLLNSSNADNTCKSSIELSSATNTSGFGSGSGHRNSAEPKDNYDDDAATKRSSVNSNDTTSGQSNNGGQSNERKRALPKHQRPLTRYLPIFSPDLNLRHHIESAGHQIALCPHVFVDAYSCRGYLHKLGATFHGWARRWFVLDRQRSAFMYFSDKSERKPRGGAYFSTIDEVYLDHLNASKSGRPHCTFIVKTKKRSYHLQAASDAAARIWIDAIITGAQGNLDY